jgi:hypothetical protein
LIFHFFEVILYKIFIEKNFRTAPPELSPPSEHHPRSGWCPGGHLLRRQPDDFASIRPSVHPSATRRSGEAVKWRSGEVEKRSSGLDVRFSAWTKSFATQRQMVSFASIRPSVREAVKWRSGVVDWTKSFATQRRFDYVEAKAVRLCHPRSVANRLCFDIVEPPLRCK